MKALLLYPEFPDSFWSYKHALRFVLRRAALPPLGLLTVAAMLPKDWELRLVDLNVGPLRQRDLEWADVVLVSAMIAQRDSARALIARCREAGLPIIAGGPLFTVEADQFPEVDHLVLNEAEVTLPEFLDDFARGCARHCYSSARMPEATETPCPRWDLVRVGQYASLCVQYSRGCPFDCDFCSVTAMFGHRPRVKSSAQVLHELDLLWDLGWRGGVFFVDDNLIGNKRALREDLLPALIRWRRGGRRFAFYTEASINLSDDDSLMRLMVEAGFDQVFIGIETPEEACLLECRKAQNSGRDLVGAIRLMQNAGLQVQGGFIIGFDHDPLSIFQRQIDFIQRSGIPTAMVGLLQAVPGTRLHARLRDEGRLLGETSGNNSDGSTNFVTRMNAATLREGYRDLMAKLYSPGPYYRRVRTFLREFHPPRLSIRLDVRNLVAFAGACVRLGILGRERFHYWWLLLVTALRRPRLLPLAVQLSIQGFHFRHYAAL